MKVADFARDRREVGLGQRAHHAGGLHRPHGRAHLGHALENGAGLKAVVADQRAAEGGERVLAVEVHHGGAVVHAGAEIDAHLLDNVAPHFGDVNLQHHLVAAAHDDGVDDLVGGADQFGRDVAGLLRLDRARHRTAQDHAVADTLDLDAGQAAQRRADAIEVALDGNVIGRDLVAVGVEEHDIGLADRGADDVGALRRADHGVGDLGVGDQHVLGFARQIHHGGLADAERKVAGSHRAERAGHERGVLGFLGGGLLDGIGFRGVGRPKGRRERQRGDRRVGEDAKPEASHRVVTAFTGTHCTLHFCVVVTSVSSSSSERRSAQR